MHIYHILMNSFHETEAAVLQAILPVGFSLHQLIHVSFYYHHKLYHFQLSGHLFLFVYILRSAISSFLVFVTVQMVSFQLFSFYTFFDPHSLVLNNQPQSPLFPYTLVFRL